MAVITIILKEILLKSADTRKECVNGIILEEVKEAEVKRHFRNNMEDFKLI